MANLTQIPNKLFYGCSNLTYVSVPDTVTSIGDEAFENCTQLLDVNFSEGLTSIGEKAFKGCESLGIIRIPTSVTTIGAHAFEDCSNLVAIYSDSSSPATIGTNTFSGSVCPIYVQGDAYDDYCLAWSDYRSRIEITKSNVTFSDDYFKSKCLEFWDIDENGELSSDEAEKVTSFGNKFKGDTELTYASTASFPMLITIGKNEFANCSNLSQMKIGANVEVIDSNAFENCVSLTSINLPSAVNNLNDYVFEGCKNLSKINIDSVIVLGKGVFKDCVKLEYLEFRTKNILAETCYGCKNLKGVVLTEGLENIGAYAFRGTRLSSWSELNPVEQANCQIREDEMNYALTLPSTLKTIGSWAFSDSAISSICCKAKVPPTITEDVFSGIDSMCWIFVPSDSVEAYKTAYGWSQYADRILAIGADIPEEEPEEPFEDTTPYVELGDAAFNAIMVGLFDINGDGKLSEYECGKVTRIPDSCCRGNKFIKKVDLTVFPNLEIIGKNAFSGCLALEDLTWNNKLTTISDSAFSGCISLTDIDLDKNITKIGSDAFSNCSSLKNVSVGNKVSIMGDRVFDGCSSLDQIIFNGVAPSIGEDVFNETNYCPIYVGDTYKYSYDGWTEWSARIRTMSQWVSPEDYIKFSDKSFMELVVRLYDKNGDKRLVKSELTDVSTLYESQYSGLKDIDYYDFSEFPQLATLGEKAFRRNYFRFLELPSTVTSIGNQCFNGAKTLEYIIFHSPYPPTFGSMCFYETNSNWKIYVDDEYVINWLNNSAYKSRIYPLSSLYSSPVNPDASIDDTVIDGDNTVDISEFTQLEYAVLDSSSGNGCLFTDYIAKENSQFKFKIFAESGTFMSVGRTSEEFGKSVSVNADKFYDITNNGEIFNSVFAASTDTSVAYDEITFNTDAVTKTNNNNVTVTKLLDRNWNGNSDPLVLFNLYENDAIGDKPFRGKMYYFNIYEGGDLKRQYYPYVQNSTGEVVLYDSVSKSIWRAKDYTLKAGPISSLIDLDVLHFSDNKFEETVIALWDSNHTGTISTREILTVINLEDNLFLDNNCTFDTADFSLFTNLRTIGNKAFYWSNLQHNVLPKLTNVILPNSVTSIGDGAFHNRWMLNNITLPSKLVSIGSNAFAYCDKFTSITLPSTLRSIGSMAFKNCNRLTCDIVIPEGISRIESGTFYGCNGVQKFTIPNSVYYIADSAFAYTAMQEITLPYNLAYIGGGAFSYNNYLRVVYMESSTPPTVGSSVFGECSSLERIYVPDGTETIYRNNWAEYADIIAPFSQKEEDDDAKDPNIIKFENPRWKEIVLSVFDTDGNGKLTLSEAAAVTEIGDNQFINWRTGMNFVADLSIFPNLTRIGKKAFYNSQCCVGVKFPENCKITVIDDDAFGYTSISEIEFPSSVTTLGWRAFYNTYITNVTIPSTIVNIENFVFGNRNNEFDYIVMESSVPTAASPITAENASIKVFVPEGSETAYKNTWGANYAVWNMFDYNGGVRFEDAEWEKAAAAVWSTDGDQRLYQSEIDEVTYIGESQFKGNTNITIVDLSKFTNLKRIDLCAFQECTNITKVVLPESVTVIGQSAFNVCSNLASINLPNSVKTIGSYAFQYCSKMTFGSLPTSLQSIGDYAFRGCKFTNNTLVLPSTVSQISDNSFINTSLSAVELKSTTPPTVYSNSFDWTNMEFYVPTESYDAYISASVWTTKQTQIYVFGYVSFNNAEWERLCIEKFDKDGDGRLSNREARQITYINDNTFANKGNEAFAANFDFLPKLTDMGNSVFSNSKISSFVIPSAISVLRYGMFSDCENLASIEITDNITTLGGACFQRCTALTNVKIGKGVSRIERYCFNCCSALKQVTLPTNVTSVGEYAFSGIEGLTVVIYYSGGMIPVETNNFADGTILYVDDTLYKSYLASYPNCTIKKIGGSEYDYAVTFEDKEWENILISCYGGAKGYVTAYDLTKVTDTTNLTGTYGNTNLTKVDFSYFVNLVKINQSQFRACSNLATVVWNSALEIVDKFAFYDCNNLVINELPNTLKSIGTMAFYNTAFYGLVWDGNWTDSTERVMKFNPPMSYVGTEAFTMSSTKYPNYPNATYYFTHTNYPNTTTYIGQCFGSNVTINAITPPTYSETAFENVNYIFVPESAVADYKNEWSELKDKIYRIGDDPTKYVLVNNEAWQNKLVELFDTDNDGRVTKDELKTLRTIDATTFGDITIENLDLSVFTNLESIADNAFANNTKIKSVTFPQSLTTIGASAFNGCSGLSGGTITIPRSVVTIGAYAFCNCKLSNIKFGAVNSTDNLLTTIGDYAFFGEIFTSFYVPVHVTNVGKYFADSTASAWDIYVYGAIASVRHTWSTEAFSTNVRYIYINPSYYSYAYNNYQDNNIGVAYFRRKLIKDSNLIVV